MEPRLVSAAIESHRAPPGSGEGQETFPQMDRIGRYEIIAELGRGAMGIVYKARDPLLDRIVAVKTIVSPKGSGRRNRRAYLERFEREAKAAAKLRSPHVVQILDYGVDEGVPFIVMELLQGEDLRSRLKRVGRLSPEQAAPIITQACKALRLAAGQSVDLVEARLGIGDRGDVQPGRRQRCAGKRAGQQQQTFLGRLVAQLRAEGRSVFVNMTAAWCITCLVNERTALSTDGVRQVMAQRGIVYLKGDWTSADSRTWAALRPGSRRLPSVRASGV